MVENAPSQVILSWQTLSAPPVERSKNWYAIGSVLVLMFAAYGLFQGSWLTALVAILMGGVYFLMRNEKPKMITVRITGIGMQIEEKIIPWNAIKDFWILLGRNYVELHLSPQGMVQGETVVYIRDPQTAANDAIDPGNVRTALLQFLPERSGMQERFLDGIARLLKL
ncbi:MAG TPA: hypothetical protein VJB82_02395 [Candidatus Peribacterales bacterium]|nr:hypothetical protein [Candidatus Peribacterales bacterium]